MTNNFLYKINEEFTNYCKTFMNACDKKTYYSICILIVILIILLLIYKN
jgi:hypothetical protein